VHHSSDTNFQLRHTVLHIRRISTRAAPHFYFMVGLCLQLQLLLPLIALQLRVTLL
jgi:hypothetical protein